LKTYVHTKTCTQIFIIALFAILNLGNKDILQDFKKKKSKDKQENQELVFEKSNKVG